MDGVSLQTIFDLISGLGLPGVILVLWFFSMKAQEKALQAYRDDTQKTLLQYRENMGEMRQMYESNAELVEDYQSVASDLKELVVMNTTAITRLIESVNGNQYCPKVRLNKEAPGKVVDQ